MKRIGSMLALAFAIALLAPEAASASVADSSRNCDAANLIRTCLTLSGLGGDLDAVRSSITNSTDADFCGTLYVSKNDSIDWKDVPECVAAAEKVVVIWDVSGHAPFPDGTVICSQFITDAGVLGGQPCVVTPIPPPRGPRNTNKCNALHGLNQCIFVSGFIVHVDYVRGTEFGIPNGAICGFEKRYENGTLKANSRLCVPKGSGSSSYVRWNVDRNYQKGTAICTRYRTDHGTWSGRPCGVVG